MEARSAPRLSSQVASTSTHSAIVGEAVIAITSPLATSTSRPVINTGRAVYSATRCPAHRLACQQHGAWQIHQPDALRREPEDDPTELPQDETEPPA